MKKSRYRDLLDAWMKKNCYDFRDVDVTILQFIEYLELMDELRKGDKDATEK